jgi:ABC-2 type transport system ATP-binding protein
MQSLTNNFSSMKFQANKNGQIRVESTSPIILGPLVRFIEEQGCEVLEAFRQRPSLEDVFVQVTGIELDAMRKEKEKVGANL